MGEGVANPASSVASAKWVATKMPGPITLSFSSLLLDTAGLANGKGRHFALAMYMFLGLITYARPRSRWELAFSDVIPPMAGATRWWGLRPETELAQTKTGQYACLPLLHGFVLEPRKMGVERLEP